METSQSDTPRCNSNADAPESDEAGSTNRVAVAAVLLGCAVIAVAAVGHSGGEQRGAAATAPSDIAYVIDARPKPVVHEYFPARFDPPAADASGNVKTFEHD